MSSNKYSYHRADADKIARAFRHPGNLEPILICTVIFIVVGMLMVVIGGVICLIYYTEITPPNFDSNYHRYIGSSVPRIIGPLLIAFGGLLAIGDIVVIGLAIQQYRSQKNDTDRTKQLEIINESTTGVKQVSN